MMERGQSDNVAVAWHPSARRISASAFCVDARHRPDFGSGHRADHQGAGPWVGFFGRM